MNAEYMNSRHLCRWEDDIKMDSKGGEYKEVDGINLVHRSDCRAVL